MTRIQRLPDRLVDQIAAGEVVERPASVVKELVENAVDAGARRIRVEIREGGAGLVAVTDDGSGMGPEDARLAVERHATSKLREAADLSAIASFGFRGEALPAIASVSRFRLRTRPEGAALGTELRIDHGRLLEAREAGGPVGTRIEVADLFASVPARRKFLKTPVTEWGHVADWMARAALALPQVHFEVQRDARPALRWPAVDDPLERVAAVLSEREAESLVPAAMERGGLALRAFVSRPDVHRRTASGLYLFVNGRPVRDRLLRHALGHAYRDWLPRGRFPTAVLLLDVPPESVDVNVHPAKWEVRFRDPQAVHSLVVAALRDAMARRGWLAGGAQRGDAAEGGRLARAAPGPSAAPSATTRSFAGPAGSLPSDWLLADAASAPLAPESAADAPGEAGPAARPWRFAALRLLGQLHATYLLAEDAQGLVLIDQHAAHERVLYERLREAWMSGGVERQPLLAPEPVEIDAARAAALDARQDALVALGFEVERFGDETALVRAVPALLAGRDPAALVRALADELRADEEAGGGGEGSAMDVRRLEAADRVFATMACHAARRAGDALDAREQRALLDALDAVPWAPTCPHGRPVAVPLGRGEIERRFGRS